MSSELRKVMCTLEALADVWAIVRVNVTTFLHSKSYCFFSDFRQTFFDICSFFSRHLLPITRSYWSNVHVAIHVRTLSSWAIANSPLCNFRTAERLTAKTELWQQWRGGYISVYQATYPRHHWCRRIREWCSHALRSTTSTAVLQRYADLCDLYSGFYPHKSGIEIGRNFPPQF